MHHAPHIMPASESSFSSSASSHRPCTPDARRPASIRTGVINPQSQYLRDALDAQRGQRPHTPSATHVRAPSRTASNTSKPETPEVSPDVFLEYALSEEQTAPVPPTRRRQLSDAALPRGKTNRELTDEIQKLKDGIMTANMRVELLKKDNSKLRQDLTKAKEELEPLESDIERLKDEKKDLVSQISDMHKAMQRLQKEINDQRESNKELIAINDECSTHWSNQEAAVKEAAEIITRLQEDKVALNNELLDLKVRVTALETSSSPGGQVDGTARCPSRVKSIDDSRPSASIFSDSDYYSQPESPPHRSNASIYSFTTSERSVRFHELSKRNRRSAHNLQKRMTALSMKASELLEESPIPDVPQIPQVFQPEIQDEEEEGVRHTSELHHSNKSTWSLHDAAPPSPPLRPSTVAPKPSSRRHEGLRGLHHTERQGRSRVVSGSRPLSSHGSTRFASRPKSLYGTITETSLNAPPHNSSHHARTSISSENQLHHNTHRQQSEHNMRPTSPVRAASLSSGRAPTAPTSPMSDDSTTEPDPQGWLKDIQQLTRSQQQEEALLLMQAASPHVKFNEETISSVRKSKTMPSQPLMEGRNLLSQFRGEDGGFISRVKSKIGSSTRRARSRSKERVRR